MPNSEYCTMVCGGIIVKSSLCSPMEFKPVVCVWWTGRVGQTKALPGILAGSLMADWLESFLTCLLP